MEFFGLSIDWHKPVEKKSAGIVPPANEDGASVVSTSASAYYGVYLDVDGAIKNETQAIQSYREVASYPEIDLALQDIINEAIPHEDDRPQISLVMDELDASDQLKDAIEEAFNNVLSKLEYNRNASDIFRKWYVDSRIYYQILVDVDNPRSGIIELRAIDPTKIRKVKEIKRERSPQGVDVIKEIKEYYVYNEAGFAAIASAQNNTATNPVQGIKISPDAIVYVPSGLLDPTNVMVQGYLHKAIRPINQLRMLEDATIVYRIARAPERRIFYIDVGNLPKAKAEQHIKDIMNTYRNKMVYDAKTGNIRDDKKYMSMLEDFWLPRRDGNKGTEITTLPGAQNPGMVDEVTYFQQKVYQSLNIPVARMQPDTGFSLGRTTEVTRDELKFQKFIDKLRRKFSQLFYDLLKTELVLRGICNNLEWEEEFKEKIFFRFQRDNYFAELKELDILQARMAIMPQIDPYLGKYWSKQWVQKNILRMTDEDIKEMAIQINSEKDDPTAQPSFAGGGMGGDPNAMGGGMGGMVDPSMMGGGMPPDDGSQDPQDQQDLQYQPQNQ